MHNKVESGIAKFLSNGFEQERPIRICLSLHQDNGIAIGQRKDDFDAAVRLAWNEAERITACIHYIFRCKKFANPCSLDDFI